MASLGILQPAIMFRTRNNNCLNGLRQASNIEAPLAFAKVGVLFEELSPPGVGRRRLRPRAERHRAGDRRLQTAKYITVRVPGRSRSRVNVYPFPLTSDDGELRGATFDFETIFGF